MSTVSSQCFINTWHLSIMCGGVLGLTWLRIMDALAGYWKQNFLYGGANPLSGLDVHVRGLHDSHHTRILRVTFAWHMRQIHAGCASHPRIRRNCCSHLPHEERATRDVTFGPLCISRMWTTDWRACTCGWAQNRTSLPEYDFIIYFYRETRFANLVPRH
jgi:hypothetical protein